MSELINEEIALKYAVYSTQPEIDQTSKTVFNKFNIRYRCCTYQKHYLFQKYFGNNRFKGLFIKDRNKGILTAVSCRTADKIQRNVLDINGHILS